MQAANHYQLKILFNDDLFQRIIVTKVKKSSWILWEHLICPRIFRTIQNQFYPFYLIFVQSLHSMMNNAYWCVNQWIELHFVSSQIYDCSYLLRYCSSFYKDLLHQLFDESLKARWILIYRNQVVWIINQVLILKFARCQFLAHLQEPNVNPICWFYHQSLCQMFWKPLQR